MIKNGRFCIYNNKEYKLNKNMEDNLIIITDDPQSLNEGFTDVYNSGVFSKIVSRNELRKCYRITTFGKVNGTVVNISKENGNEYLVGTSDEKTAQKLKLNRTDKHYYESWLPKNKVEVFEKNEEIDMT